MAEQTDSKKRKLNELNDLSKGTELNDPSKVHGLVEDYETDSTEDSTEDDDTGGEDDNNTSDDDNTEEEEEDEEDDEEEEDEEEDDEDDDKQDTSNISAHAGN